MANDLRQYQRIKDAYEEMRRRKERTDGALEEMYRRLHENHGCRNKEEATKLAKAMREKREKILEEYESELNLLREKYQDVFEEHGIEIEEGIGTLPLRRVSRQG
jgi:division protein CdvB (Snf7/Vps24/ESCRT-III family)